jgi:Protein of unknown function (DUF3501)
VYFKNIIQRFMTPLTPQNLMTLEIYETVRTEMRKKAIALRKQRTVMLGEHMKLDFENEFLVRYQVLEMVRIKNLIDPQKIQDEIDAVKALIPTGTNLKASMLLEYPGRPDRIEVLKRMRGVEKKIFIQVEGQPRVYAIADEDIDFVEEEKTAAVHFLRFELPQAARQSLKGGAQMMVGCYHPEYPMHVGSVEPETLASLIEDLL